VRRSGTSRGAERRRVALEATMNWPLPDLLAGLSVGLVGGVTSGLLGVSPGGGLVVSANLLLGSEQHVAQGISLFAQIPPTGISGVKRYWEKGARTPVYWLAHLGVGFIFGGVAGALAAGSVSSSFLRWSYVLYLAGLDALLFLRPARPRSEETTPEFSATPVAWPALTGVGFLAGFSSGFLGIGGGLAITAGLSAGLRVPQHQAQLVSLVFSIIPATIPAAWIYWRSGWSAPWLLIAGVVAGLWVGTDFGARMANRLSETALQLALLCFVTAMTIYMAYRAIT
jgi:uncharacterized membrane protein YfcA